MEKLLKTINENLMFGKVILNGKRVENLLKGKIALSSDQKEFKSFRSI
jgi:hypothetical protein